MRGTEHLIAVCLIGAAALAQTLFALIYGLTTPWWRSRFGKALLFKSSVIAVLLDLAMLSLVWKIPAWLALLVYAGILVGSWWQLIALMLEKRAGRREDVGAMHPNLPTD